MKLQNLHLRLSVVESEIDSLMEQIDVLKTLPYYRIFDKRKQQLQEIRELKLKIKNLIAVKDGILDNMLSAIHQEKIKDSKYQRELILGTYV